MSRTPYSEEAAPAVFCFGAPVSVTLLGGYPVTGTIKAFVPGACGDIAVICISQDIGLYEHGDIITVPVTALKAVA